MTERPVQALGLQIDGIELMVRETKDADGFYEAWAFLSSGILDGVLVGHAFARSKRRAKAYALGKYIAQIALSIEEDGWA